MGANHHLGSAAITIDGSTSELVERTTYQAFGALESDYRPWRWDSHREDWKFTGKEEDIEVGLTYFGARYYQPYLGRWASADPLTIHGLGADLNPYAYVGGRVMSHVDPFGLDSCGPDDAKTVKCGGSTVTREGTNPEGGAIYNIEDPAPASPAAGGTERGWSREVDHAIDAAERLANTAYEVPGTGGGTITPVEYEKAAVNHMVDALESTATWSNPLSTAAKGVNAALGVRGTPRFRVNGGPRDMSDKLALVMTVLGSVALGAGAPAPAAEAALPRGGTYLLRNPITNQVMRTGRTGDLARRAAEHARDPALRNFVFEVVHRTDDYATRRGLEQLLHQLHNPPLNKISPIDPRNPRLPEYMAAAKTFLGIP